MTAKSESRHTALPQFFTIGVYGSTEETFFDALISAHIDTFCDIRRRRGLRGHEYAYANAIRLQEELATRSIRYVHFMDLSPTDAVRKRQAEVDEAHHVARRKRHELSPEFVEAYKHTVLAHFDSRAFLDRLPDDAKKVVLFCVEREPSACHRSLLAHRLELDLGMTVTHLIP